MAEEAGAFWKCPICSPYILDEGRLTQRHGFLSHGTTLTPLKVLL